MVKKKSAKKKVVKAKKKTEAKKTKDNGIEIIERKNGFITKKIRNKGFTLMTYHRCPNPKFLKFKSPMVNDLNQDLCGGWYRHDFDHQIETVRRVIVGLKPFGAIGGYNVDLKFLDESKKSLRKAGFAINHIIFEDGRECVEFCIKNKTLNDLFDLKSLAADYDKFLPEFCIGQEILESANVRLDSFLNNNWDRIPWVTGLILGYPIENTISLYQKI